MLVVSYIVIFSMIYHRMKFSIPPSPSLVHRHPIAGLLGGNRPDMLHMAAEHFALCVCVCVCVFDCVLIAEE